MYSIAKYLSYLPWEIEFNLLSRSELIDNIGSDTYANDHATIADSEASNPRGKGSAMQVDDEGLKQLAPRKRPQYSGSRNFDNDSSDSETSDDARPSKYVKSGDGTSKSAVASRSLRNSVKSGTFNINQEKFQNWKSFGANHLMERLAQLAIHIHILTTRVLTC